MISEGSCDTEDWRNDAENTALITGKKKVKVHDNKKQIVIRFTIFQFLLYVYLCLMLLNKW